MVANVVEMPSGSVQVADLHRVFQVQKQAFRHRPMPTAAERLSNLDALARVLRKYQDELAQAVSDDFGHRSQDETKIAEILTSLEGVKYYSKNLRKWMRPEKRHVGLLQAPGTAKVFYQPLGVVGVIVPWNYPIFLATGPLTCALAAGNRVMIKMSGFTPRLGETFKKMLAEAFSEDQVAVFTGRGEISEEFSKLPFDQLTFTGSTNVGRTVMAEAAKNLTPVILELGGKSPAIVHESYGMTDAAERIAFGKCWNAGQTCVAPDYLLLPKGKTQAFVDAFTAQVSKMYPTMVNNPDFTSVINDKQYNRIQGYLDDARTQGAKIVEINPAKEKFENTRKMPVTLVTGVRPEMQIMQNEIFGPVLAVMEYNTLDDALRYINDRPRPLALYYFDWDSGRADYVAAHTHSGGMCINETLSHVGAEDLPFGGVGASGMGRYHGREGFIAMSNAKAVLEKPRLYSIRFVLPPFNKSVHKILKNYFLK
ncbi:MAG: aldehyde dehydrogenase [Moraxellaceae bacterium]|jgi:coniferyl-aldehyde dehydrogenase|nr:aldehyde dehydrogenase [Moraxellaceae bacterium]